MVALRAVAGALWTGYDASFPGAKAMKKPSRAGGKPAKARPKKALKAKGRSAPKALSHRGAAPARETEVARLTCELNEALEQQAATSEVLAVISSPSGKLERVFQSILEKATRICEAKFGLMYLYESGAFRNVASQGAPPAYVELRRREPVFHPVPEHPLAQVAATRQVFHVADIAAVRGRLADLGGARTLVIVPMKDTELVELAGVRTLLVMPMLKENGLIGAITIYRQEVRPFSEKQIALVQNFASQAVIAIENARLLNELRQRTNDLSEVLKQQTATSEVLHVISSSPSELDPVFQTILANATRICQAQYGNLYLFEDDAFRLVGSHSTSTELAWERLGGPPVEPAPGTGLGRIGVLVYFGYPRAHEDDAERAVRSGLELIQAVGGLKFSNSLQSRVGIATGLVVVGATRQMP